MALLPSLSATHLPFLVQVPLFGLEFLLGLFVIPSQWLSALWVLLFATMVTVEACRLSHLA
jgi:hypothetical protein